MAIEPEIARKEHEIKQLETEIALANGLFDHYQQTANLLSKLKQRLIGELMMLKRDIK